MFLEGKVNFEAGKYTEMETAALNKVKQLDSLEKHLARNYCGKFQIEETESFWEIYLVNMDGTLQNWACIPKAKDDAGTPFFHYVRVFAESMRLPDSQTNEITEVVKYCNNNLSEYFFLKPCLADDGRQGIEIALTQEYSVNFNLE